MEAELTRAEEDVARCRQALASHELARSELRHFLESNGEDPNDTKNINSGFSLDIRSHLDAN
jgi:hypothetical protein